MLTALGSSQIIVNDCLDPKMAIEIVEVSFIADYIRGSRRCGRAAGRMTV
jgi:hypothetical protein